jgi:hypothetical protein
MSQLRNTVKNNRDGSVFSVDMAVEVLGVAQQLNALQHAALQVTGYASSVLLVTSQYALQYIGNFLRGKSLKSVVYRLPQHHTVLPWIIYQPRNFLVHSSYFVHIVILKYTANSLPKGKQEGVMRLTAG